MSEQNLHEAISKQNHHAASPKQNHYEADSTQNHYEAISKQNNDEATFSRTLISYIIQHPIINHHRHPRPSCSERGAASTGKTRKSGLILEPKIEPQ